MIFYRKTSNHTVSSAFTLIELLVVVAIIAILAALLLPNLFQAKNQAYKTVCLNNIKEVMLAETLYINDNLDFPAWPNWFGGNNAAGRGWACNPATFEQQVKGGFLWSYTRNPFVFVCPMDMLQTNSDAIPPGMTASPQNTYKALYTERTMTFISYVCNGAIINWPAGESTLKATLFRGSDVLFWEGDTRVPFFLNDGSSPPSQGLTIRHDNGGMIAAFDDHAEYMTYPVYYSQVGDPPFPEPGITPVGPLPNIFWCDPQDPDGGYWEGY